MADSPQNTTGAETRRFDKSLNENLNDFHLPDNQWTHARNVINNSKTGDLGKLGNEPATLYCVQIGTDANAGTLTAIGCIHVIADKWVIFSTNSTTSEIGYFEEGRCRYVTLVNDPCLNFSVYHLIKGVSRATSECTYKIYWDDGLNPSRFITFDLDAADVFAANAYTNPNSPIPWNQICTDSNGTDPGGCITCVNQPTLNCEKIRLAPFITPPCIRLTKGVNNGTLPNGSYMVATAYALKGQKIGDYTVSNIQPLFDHRNTASALDVSIESSDKDFDEMIVVLIATVNQQTVAKKAGIYSTRQQLISFDLIDNRWETIPIEQIPLMIPVPEKTDKMFNVGDYLIRSGITSKEDFNYQPLANQIVVKWVNVQYPADYYRKGGNKVGYMRDEVYSFFVRWVYTTGDKSNSYHIPGRPFSSSLDGGTSSVYTDKLDDANIKWKAENTARVLTAAQSILPDGGRIIAKGLMSYWESSEFYPDTKPQIWNSVTNPIGSWFNTSTSPYNGLGASDYDVNEHDLCGKRIRHHKFPSNYLESGPLRYKNAPNHFQIDYTTGAIVIAIMGVEFSNIKAPVDLDGNVIPGIAGYEILRGSRNGNKTVIAKGVISNMVRYEPATKNFSNIQDITYLPINLVNATIPSSETGIEYYYPNYPYNDLRPDPFMSVKETNYNPPNFLGIGQSNSESYQLQDSYYAYLNHNMLTFHSPDTNFTNPYLYAKEMKVYEELFGRVTGQFQYSEKHPGEKLITNNAFFMSLMAGLALALLSMNGKRTKTREALNFNSGQWLGGGIGPLNVEGSFPTAATMLGGITTFSIARTAFNVINNMGKWLLTSLAGLSTDIAYVDLAIARGIFEELGTGAVSADTTFHQEAGAYDNTPFPLRLIAGAPMFLYYLSEGADQVMELIRAIMKYQKFALRYESHCWYNTSMDYPLSVSAHTNKRSVIKDQQYLGPQISNFTSNKRINNLYRSRTVAIELDSEYYTGSTIQSRVPIPRIPEVTRIRASEVDSLWDIELRLRPALKRPTKYSFGYTNSSFGYGSFNGFLPPLPLFTAAYSNFTQQFITNAVPQQASALYVGLKQRLRNQYGQLNNIVQLYASSCMIPYNTSTATSSGIIFGGDTYVGRYTEKNTFYYFYDWMYDQPDGSQFDYTKYEMIPYPRYWGNFDQFETSDFVNSLASGLGSLVGSIAGIVDQDNTGLTDSLDTYLTTPSDFYNLDGLPGTTITWSSGTTGNIDTATAAIYEALGAGGALRAFRFSVKDAYYYLFNSGVKDFYVESEINIDLRDWGEDISERHYDPFLFTDLKSMFDTRIIKAGNYYKYDISLSVSNLFVNYLSWATNQAISYDPFKAETCYTYTPTRVIYSLPAQYEGLKDQWRIFLPNNYYDFDTTVTCIKPINKSGAIILFDSASPVMFQGTDQLETTIGTKLTIGDGGLFSQPLQNIINAEFAYEYASCQDRLSVINTPVGIYWISQNQGKIFNMTNGLEDITMETMKWWFAQYLPYKLIKEPIPNIENFELLDNPVSGIGCQAVYDNENGLLYFLKKDYTLKPNLGDTVTYIDKDNFSVNGNLIIKLGDPTYFNDASWTASYDPKLKQWLGWHDWHPDFLLPGKNTFMSINKTGSYIDVNGTTIPAPNSIWIHNLRADLYCNYYGVDYPFEVEYTVNTIQEVNTLRSIEYIMEVYKYAVNEYDRFHVLDFNFDEAVVYNTEQVSGLLKLNLNPRQDPSTMITYPIINPTSIDVLYSKVENKFRINQFWDITDDRGEYNPFAQRTIWNTEDNGYIRSLNQFNLNYNKAEFQRKKFRHYTNSVFLRRKVSGDRKMLVMLANDKLLNSPR